MDIYSLLQRGEYHPICCEDFILTEEIEDELFIAAVMDGCSNGTESHFASTLFGKLLRKICKIIPHIHQASALQLPADALGKWILQQLFNELNATREQLFLNQMELLSTLILLVYKKSTQEAFVIALGDGVIAIDGQIHAIDQQNMPDYLSYHLAKDFDEWFKKQKHIFKTTAPKQLSISTDGIESFMTHKHESPPIDVPNYLLNDLTFAELKNMLAKKTQVLYAQHGISPKDDLGIIRVIF